VVWTTTPVEKYPFKLNPEIKFFKPFVDGRLHNEDIDLLHRCFYPIPEISDFKRTNFEFSKSEQKYPVKTTLEYAHKYSLLCKLYPRA
jgi:hypothetical protein